MSMSYQKRSKEQLAQRVAQDIHDGAYVNLGIGMPMRVAEFLPPDRECVLHSENGLLGMGPAPDPGAESPDLINAGKPLYTSGWMPRFHACISRSIASAARSPEANFSWLCNSSKRGARRSRASGAKAASVA